MINLGGRFGYIFFFCSGRGGGSPRPLGVGGGVRFLNEIPKAGGGEGRGQGAGRVSAANWGFCGLNIFFRVRNVHQVNACQYRQNFWCAATAQFSRKRSENAGASEDLSCGFPSIWGVALGVAPRILKFHIAQVVRCHSRNGISSRITLRIPRVAPELCESS